MNRINLSLILILFFLSFKGQAQSTANDLVFNIQVTAYDNSTILSWNQLPNVNNYNVLRKARSEKNFTVVASNLPASQTSFMDVFATKGVAYEYAVQSAVNNNISGYVYAGKELAAVHQAGEVLLVIDNTYQTSAEQEINMYRKDLIKEGWKVSTVYVSRTQSVASVKTLISDAYNANPTGFKGTILLGHVPVPYSGNIAPDAHTDHIGAWPSDVFYADVAPSQTNLWNDATINSTSATDIRNRNVIGDGKFDVSAKASNCCIKLFVGRIDVFNMPAINADDVLLFKQYLLKNHAYRSVQKTFRQKGIVQDNFGYFSGEAFAQNGWRNMSNLIGAENVQAGNYFSSLQSNSYIWSYACGGGTYTSAQNIGNTTNFKSSNIESVFTMLYGSYFGDWDNKNNFLRAPIASPSSTLVSIWGGRPNWFMHTMSLGEPIGYSYINSVENAGTYFPRGLYSGQVHQSLQGDPTLKMYMFEAPSNLFASVNQTQDKVSLSWNASNDASVLGYYIYKANSENEDFQLLNTEYTTNTTFEETLVDAYNPDAVYMVKAVKLEQTITGSFFNLSPGTMSSQSINVALPVTLTAFAGNSNADKTNTLTWNVEHEINMISYILERSDNSKTFETLAMINANHANEVENEYQYVDANPMQENFYRLKMIDLNGDISYSDVVRLSTTSSEPVVSVYPSPFNNQLHIQYASEVNTNLTVVLTDMYGKRIQQHQFAMQAGTNIIDLQNIEQLSKGLYIITLFDTEANTKQQFKVMKE